MKELSLFSGIGGGLLASYLLGWECVGYVEWDKYCCNVLEQRIKEGHLHKADIYEMDIKEFNEEIAPFYKGKVDVITAGFPCQPFSIAGKRAADSDKRNQWPETFKTICIVQPRWMLLENVPGLLTHKYIRRIYGDLAKIGYDARWDCISAAHCGANHKRLRWWLVGYSKSNGYQE